MLRWAHVVFGMVTNKTSVSELAPLHANEIEKSKVALMLKLTHTVKEGKISKSCTCRVGQNHIYMVYKRHLWQDITKYTVTYGVYTRFWPTLTCDAENFKAVVC
jgi:hypothetical protein